MTKSTGKVKKAFVLAAGFGTRLRPVSDRVPKGGWPFFGVPLGAHVLASLAKAGVEEVVINLHHLPEELKAALSPWIPETMEVKWSFEETILGTGGALKPWVKEFSDGPFFLINADTYRELDLTAMIRSHEEAEAAATLALAEVGPEERGPIGVDGMGRITRFLNAQAPDSGGEASRCDFAGVHLLEPEILQELALVEEEKFCINARVHTELVEGGAHYSGYVMPPDRFWSDLGTPGRYLAAHRELLEVGELPPLSRGRLVREREQTPEGGVILPPSYIEGGVTVGHDAVVGPYAVLGRGVKVVAGARVVDSCLWAGATATGDVEDSIITERGETMTPHETIE